MFNKLTLGGAIAAAALAVMAVPSTTAANNGCNLSTKRMSISCRAEAREDYFATLARCASLNDEGDRADCVEETFVNRQEAESECREQRDAREGVCQQLGEDRYLDPLTDETISFVDPDDVGDLGVYPNNPYVIIQAGHTHVLRGEEIEISEPDEETGDPGGEEETSVEIIVVYATDEVREIEGVLCRVVVDIVLEPEFDEEEGEMGFEPIEVTDDWFAQDTEQNVYYCGEVAQNFEDGVLRDLDGSFEAGLDRAEGGLLIASNPLPGVTHRQEYALGEAEDLVQYLTGFGTPLEAGVEDVEGFPCGEEGAGGCLQTYEFSPQEPNAGEFKYYLPGVGFVLSVPLEEGEPVEDSREWLVCSGDSLDILSSPECGFGVDAEELLSTLCDLSDEFCDDGES